MELLLKRIAKKPTHTIGKLHVNNVYECDVLENPVRTLGPNGEGKIKGNTAIPAGRYEVVLNWSPRFRCVMPLLLKVPFFEGIRIHPGNTVKDTDGCLLPGENKAVGKVLNSRVNYNKLMAKMKATNEKIFITIV